LLAGNLAQLAQKVSRLVFFTNWLSFMVGLRTGVSRVEWLNEIRYPLPNMGAGYCYMGYDC
jgi:hypothetical protein